MDINDDLIRRAKDHCELPQILDAISFSVHYHPSDGEELIKSAFANKSSHPDDSSEFDIVSCLQQEIDLDLPLTFHARMNRCRRHCVQFSRSFTEREVDALPLQSMRSPTSAEAAYTPNSDDSGSLALFSMLMDMVHPEYIYVMDRWRRQHGLTLSDEVDFLIGCMTATLMREYEGEIKSKFLDECNGWQSIFKALICVIQNPGLYSDDIDQVIDITNSGAPISWCIDLASAIQ